LSEILSIDEELEEEFEEFDPDDSPCFGEYGQYSVCSDCSLRTKCKRFTEAEKNVTIRHKGKYTGTGKERRRDKY